MSPIVTDEITKNKLMKTKRTPTLNNDEHQLNHTICEKLDKKENDKEDHLAYEEDRTQQDLKEERKNKGENITYN